LNRQDAKFAKEEERNSRNQLSFLFLPLSPLLFLGDLGVLAVQFFAFQKLVGLARGSTHPTFIDLADVELLR
jgi:hypothetical protein